MTREEFETITPTEMDNEDLNLRLEYSHQQGCFHFDNGTHKADTKGWVTICGSLPDNLCSAFFNRCLSKYPVFEYFTENRKQMYHPTVEDIRIEFDDFLRLINKGQ